MLDEEGGPRFDFERLRALREGRHLTRTGLAAELGVSHTYIQNLEKGLVRMPTAPYLDLLARFFGVRPSDLVIFSTSAGGERSSSYEPLDAELQGVQVNLKKLKELSPEDIKVVDRVVQSMLREAEEEEKERRRAERRRKDTEPPGQSD